MSTATLPPPAMPVVLPPPPAAALTPRRRVWTCEDLYRFREMRDAWFGGSRLILIDGEILEMPAPGPQHNVAVGLCDYWLKSVFPPPAYWVRIEMGLPFGINTDPIPDLAVVTGGPRTHAGNDPTTAELVVEVADSSRAHDMGVNASLYAAAGIRDYWVLDVDHRLLFVFRDPRPDAAAHYGHAYFHQTTLGPTDTVAPLAAPHAAVTVAELLP